MNNFGDVDDQLIMFINLGLAEQVIRSHGLAAVPIDSRFIDYQLLRLAVQRNETRIAQLLIDRGFRVNSDATRGENADTPLHFAVERRNNEMLLLLLKHYASVEHKNEHGLTALQTAVKLRNFTAVYTIMRELESRDYLQRLIQMGHLSTMHAACLRGDVDDFHRVLECGISIKEPVPLSSPIWPGCTNLHLAVISRCVELMDLLILRGIDTTTKDIMNLTALQLAVNTGDKALVRQLLCLYVENEVDLEVEHTDGMTYLHHACTLDKDSQILVRALLEKGANVHATTSLALTEMPGYTPLHFAVKYGNFENVRELMDYGANPSIKNGHGETPLHLTGGHPQIVAACFENYNHYDIDTRDRYGTSHFHIACLYGRHRVVAGFLSHGSVIDINTRIQMTPTLITYHGSTPLQLALRLDVPKVYDSKQAKVVHLLLESPDIDVNARDTYGQTALHIAVSSATKPMSVEAIAHHSRTDVNARNPEGQTALHLAVQREDMYAQLNSLLLNNSDVYAQDAKGQTPLHVAHKAVLPMLLLALRSDNMYKRNPRDEYGISIFDIACNDYQLPCARGVVERFLQAGTIKEDHVRHILSQVAMMTDVLHAAVEGRYLTTVMTLLRLGLTNAKVTDAMGATALHIVATKSEIHVPEDHSTFIARILIDEGVNIEATVEDSKRTALHRAAKYDSLGIIELLLKHGANVMARDRWQNTPLHLAAESCNRDAVLMLIAAGADVNARDASGGTPLHKIPGSSNERVAEPLVYMPWFTMIPVERYSVIIDILLYSPTSHGTIDAKDNAGMTPLCIAFETDNPACTKAFLDHGADPETVWHRLMKLLLMNQRRQGPMLLIAQQMIRLRAAKKLKDKSLSKLLWDFGMENGTHAALERECHRELARMATVFIDPYTTIKDLLYKSDIALKSHLANYKLQRMLVADDLADQNKEQLELLLEDYPNYAPLLRRIYRYALLRVDLVQESSAALEAIALHVIPGSVKRGFPDPCFEAILGMIDVDDMRNLVEAVYYKRM